MARTVDNGYGAAHRRLRRRVARVVEAGDAVCWRCNQPIQPDEKWHLGHDDQDRSVYRGPEHERCNLRGGPQTAFETSRDW